MLPIEFREKKGAPIHTKIVRLGSRPALNNECENYRKAITMLALSYPPA